MRLPLVVAALLLCVATEARANPITFQVFGIVTASGLSGPALERHPPQAPPAVGSLFTFGFAFEPVGFMEATTSFGGYASNFPFTCGGCRAFVSNPLSAVTLGAIGGSVYLNNQQGLFLLATLFEVNLNQGWRSGTFYSYIETPASIQSGFVSGNVTGVRMTSAAVPEPATWLLTMLGLALVAGRSRQSAC